MDVSVITTLYQERASVEPLMESLLAQTLPAAEIVVSEAGSTDGTLEYLAELASREPRLRIIDAPGNRSAGRNRAVEAATCDVIACIDGGCVAEPDWLEHLSAPFAEGADWVAGFYRPVGRTLLSTCVGLVMVYVAEEVDPESFLPSARSMAFLRGAWAEAGGFPEDHEFAEDTLFGERLREAGYRAVFAPDAVVRWTPPPWLGALARTLFRWGRGDGRARLRGYAYKRYLALYGGTLLAVGATVGLVWWLVPVALVPLGVQTARRTRHKYRWTEGSLKYLYIPLAHLVATASGTLGWLTGRLEPSPSLRGRRGEGPQVPPGESPR